MLARQRGHRQAAGTRRLRRVSLRLAGGCLSGDGLRLLGPSSTHDCLVGFPGERRGWQVVGKTCVFGADEVAFKPQPSVEPGGCGVFGPRKEAHLLWYVLPASFSVSSLAPLFNDSSGGCCFSWWGSVLF